MIDHYPQTAAVLAPARPLEGKTVLLVEDESFIADLLTCWFQRLGAQTLWASTGQDGLRLFAEHTEEVCLVIADFRLPDMGGDEMCTKLREIKPRLPVLLSSGRYPREAEESIARGGPTIFLQKPYPLSEVRLKLQKLLEAV